MAVSHTNVFSQSCLPEGITFTTQAQIDSFQFNYPGCTSIAGHVYIHGESITNLNRLNVLTFIERDLTIGNIFESYNTALTSLSGLESLTHVGGDLNLVYNHRLKSLTGLDNLASIGGYINIGKPASEEGASYGNDSLIDLTALDGLITIGGGIGIYANKSLTCLKGLENVTSLDGGIYCWGNASLANFTGLENLTSIGGHFIIGSGGGSAWSQSDDNRALTSFKGLESLTSIGGSFQITNNSALIDFKELGALTSIGKHFRISHNYRLNSLTGLENINLASITDLRIMYNTSLSTCEISNLCDYLANPNGATTYIFSNATGCNTPEEVKALCGPVSVENPDNVDLFTIYPNPSSTLIAVVTHGSTASSFLSILNLKGQQLIFCQITEPYTAIDISALPGGVYFVKVKNEKTVEVRKIIKE